MIVSSRARSKKSWLGLVTIFKTIGEFPRKRAAGSREHAALVG
jgi:hypothetical protein